jgi:hypothetical protein
LLLIRDAARDAGVDTAFQPWTHGIHVWPVYISAGLPESALAVEDLAAFLKLHAGVTTQRLKPGERCRRARPR